MTKMDLKKRLLEVCIARQQEAAAELQHEVDETLRLSNEYGAPKDRYDPYRTKLMNQNNLFAQQFTELLFLGGKDIVFLPAFVSGVLVVSASGVLARSSV